jgi:nucleoid DNA-binding protein
MKLNELAERIGERSGVQAKVASRVMRETFALILAEIAEKGESAVPTLGRFVRREAAEGRTRIIFVPRKPATTVAEAEAEAGAGPEAGET